MSTIFVIIVNFQLEIKEFRQVQPLEVAGMQTFQGSFYQQLHVRQRGEAEIGLVQRDLYSLKILTNAPDDIVGLADGDALGNAVTTSYQIVESAREQLPVGSAKLEAHLTVLCVSVIDHCHDMQRSETILLRPSPAA
jgi:hypothetical protein